MSKAGVAKTQEFRKPSKRKRVVLEERVIDGVVTVGKECTKCDEWKSLENGFRKDNKGLGGKLSICKKCERKYREENKERIAEYSRKWHESHKEKANDERKRRYYENHERELVYRNKYREENKERIAEYRQMYYEEHKEKKVEQDRKYYERNKERIKELRRKYQEENKDKVKERRQKYYERNKERFKELHRKYREENKEVYLLIQQRRRARKKALPDDFTNEQLNEVLLDFKGSCALTGDVDIHWDHVIPLAIGHGGTTYGNMIPLRSDLNMSKQDSNIFEWFEANRQRFELPQAKFDRLIAWLAAANEMTVEEYRDYVYWCHANPNDEITNVLESEAI